MTSMRRATRAAIAMAVVLACVPAHAVGAASVEVKDRRAEQIERDIHRVLRRSKPKPLAVIWIERLGLKTNIYRGLTPDVLKKGVGYWPGTALPGRRGNLVLGGHRVTWPNPFKYIEKIQVGDKILINYRNVRYLYVVTKTFIVKPKDTWIVRQGTGHVLTLFACHPRGTYKFRYVVRATLVK